MFTITYIRVKRGEILQLSEKQINEQTQHNAVCNQSLEFESFCNVVDFMHCSIIMHCSTLLLLLLEKETSKNRFSWSGPNFLADSKELPINRRVRHQYQLYD